MTKEKEDSRTKEKGELSELECRVFQELSGTEEIEPEDYMSGEVGILMWIFVLLMIIYAAVLLVEACLHAS